MNVGNLGSAYNTAIAKEHEDNGGIMDKSDEVKLDEFLSSHPDVFAKDGNGNPIKGADYNEFMKFLKDSVSPELYNKISNQVDQMFKDVAAAGPNDKQAIYNKAIVNIFTEVLNEYDLPQPKSPADIPNNLNYAIGARPELEGIFGSAANVLLIMMLVFAEMTYNSEDIMKVDTMLMSKNTAASSVLNRYKAAMASLNGAGTMPLNVQIKEGDDPIDFLSDKIKTAEDGSQSYEIDSLADLFRLVYSEDPAYPQGETLKASIAPLYNELQELTKDSQPSIGPDFDWTDKTTFNQIFNGYIKEVNNNIGKINPKLALVTTWKTSGDDLVLEKGINEALAANIESVGTAISEAGTVSNTLQANAQFHQNTYNTNVSLLMKPEQIAETIRRIIFP